MFSVTAPDNEVQPSFRHSTAPVGGGPGDADYAPVAWLPTVAPSF